MQEITRVNHIGIRVSSLEKAKHFYRKLGFDFITGPSGPEPVAILLHPSGININLILNASDRSSNNILMDDPIKYTGYTHVALEVTNMASVLEQLTLLELTPSGGPTKHPTGISVFFRDDDNNVIELIEYAGLDGLKTNTVDNLD
ncbi:VOC family protein [Photobacterium makurazakiensis]|uniref:VOC family protein n=1 Tax=Photobacterium makurazakiensis TaxID=2910234 RepID=UPI003D0D2FB0